MQTSVLLSVKPQFAEAILAGVKGFEFRRALFRCRSVRKVILYASSPVQKVVGEFLVEDVLSMAPEALWATTQHSSGIDKPYFDSYFKGCEVGHALKVTSVTRYDSPLDLKRHFGIERPPQSFCYVEGTPIQLTPKT